MPESSLRKVTVTPYGWLSSIDAGVAVNGYSASTHVGLDQILDHLDMVGMMTVEARRGRWGGWIDGVYLAVSAESETPGRLLDSLGVGTTTLMLETALSYRLWEGPRGFVDVYGGARYNRMETELSFHPSDSGIHEVAEDLSARLVETVATAVRDRAAARVAQIEAAAQARAREAIQSALEPSSPLPGGSPLAELNRIAAADPQVKASLLRNPALQRAIDNLVAVRLAREEASADDSPSQSRPGRSMARSQAQKAVTTAEKRLTRALEKSLRDAIPDELSGTADWVDPFVGLRGRYNFNDRLYAVAKADIGGFGVGSDLTWQAYGGLGWVINHRWSTEIGYRHLSIEYGTSTGFQSDIDTSGLVVSASLRF